jgi:hypothetical protein
VLLSNSSPYPPKTPLPTAYRLAILALLLLIAGEILLSTRQQSQTFDEADHLYAGYEYWQHADFGRNPEHPPLAKLVAAAALLPLHLREPAPVPAPWFKPQDFRTAAAFLYTAAADSLLARGRAMLLIFTLALALAVFAAGREMFSPAAGLLAMTLFAFEPILLANGGLITTDSTLTCTLFCSTYAFYRYLKRPTLLRLALCAVAAGLTVAAKQSGVFIFPILITLAAAELLHAPRPTRADAPNPSYLTSPASLALALLAIATVSYAILWAFYGFRYAARPAGLSMTPTLGLYSSAIPNPIARLAILLCARFHLLPEAYLFGWADIMQVPGSRITFLLGKLYVGSRWFLFPLLLLLKTTLTLLTLLALIPVARLWRRGREFLFLALPAAIYLLIAIVSGMNAQARYLLPIYPFCIVLAAAAGCQLARRSRPWALAVAALVVFAAASSLHAFPDYLAYANEAFGGASNSYRLVNDSNGDWMQGLKWTKHYLDANKITDCWFDSFSPDIDPAYYGIPCKPLVTVWVRAGYPTPTDLPETITGTVLLSATELNGDWGPGALNPYAQFQRLRPDAVPGNVVAVYHGTFHIPLAAAYSHMAAAAALVQQHNLAAAVAESQHAAALAPGSAEIQAALGHTLMVAGRMDEGRQANSTALRLAQSIHPEFQALLIHRLQSPGMTALPSY